MNEATREQSLGIFCPLKQTGSMSRRLCRSRPDTAEGPSHGRNLELDVRSQFDQTRLVTGGEPADSEPGRLHIREATSSCITAIRAACPRTGLERWMVEDVQHFSLQAEVDRLRDGNMLGDGQIVIHVSRPMQVHKLPEGPRRSVWRNEA